MTPNHAWKNIEEYIPKDKVIWEAFYGDGKSGEYLRELGCKEVIHEPIDFFEENKGEVIISNPPYSKKKEIFTRLKELDKPFIMICPCSMLTTQYIRQLFSKSETPLQIIIPRKRIQFIKKINGEIPKDFKQQCNFDTFYYCYKMNLPRDMIWLE
jgi:hypothetical protein